MNSAYKKILTDLSFTEPAPNKIKVKGLLEQRYSGHLGGMKIKIINRSEQHVFTVLTGRVSDHSALAGILNALYEMHLSILSVKLLKDTDNY